MGYLTNITGSDEEIAHCVAVYQKAIISSKFSILVLNHPIPDSSDARYQPKPHWKSLYSFEPNDVDVSPFWQEVERFNKMKNG